MTILPVLLAAIQLSGVTGESLRARAFFDVNNAKVGDPLVLTVDFLGEADFASLHPPALSRAVSRADWKLDDASAKTDTFSDARRLMYRVRPMREGVLWFPELEFEYEGPSGEKRLVRSNAIPVHAKPGVDIVVDEMSEVDENTMPLPDALIVEPPSGLSDDELFAWRKACANPSADAFSGFGFVQARLNEARCAVLEGDWRRAIAIYSRLEWRVGQTPAIERGLVAALAARFQNPAAELPVWRQLGRPVLRYAWKGRIMLVFGCIAAVVALFWLLGRVVQKLACVALFVFVAQQSFAQAVDPFARIEEMHRQMRHEMQQMMSMPMGGGFNISFGGGSQISPDISASVVTDKPELQVADAFKFILALEVPKGVSVGQIQLSPSETFGLQQTGNVEVLPDGTSLNASNVVKRLAIPVRYDVPYKGKMTFDVQGMATVNQTMNGGRISFTSSTSFNVRSKPLEIEIKPLATDEQPWNFSGIIADAVSIDEALDASMVETNDVITITYRLKHNGYLPREWMPEGAAFEWTSGEWRRYLVADGMPRTPEVEVVYYDPKAKVYRTVKTGATPISYRAE